MNFPIQIKDQNLFINKKRDTANFKLKISVSEVREHLDTKKNQGIAPGLIPNTTFKVFFFSFSYWVNVYLVYLFSSVLFTVKEWHNYIYAFQNSVAKATLEWIWRKGKRLMIWKKKSIFVLFWFYEEEKNEITFII